MEKTLHQRINEMWDLSNDAYPAILARQRRKEAWRAKLKIRETFRYQFCRALRKALS